MVLAKSAMNHVHSSQLRHVIKKLSGVSKRGIRNLHTPRHTSQLMHLGVACDDLERAGGFFAMLFGNQNMPMTCRRYLGLVGNGDELMMFAERA